MRIPLLSLAFLLALSAPAFAQISFGGGGGGGGGGHHRDKDDDSADESDKKKKDQPKPPPDALPGAHVNAERVTPADRNSVDMEPNDALFDSINRGDIGAAREAIGRGARVDSRNVLGMTPVDLAIDLNRNDILFLLLSYRGGDDGGRQAAPTRTATATKGKADKRSAHRGEEPKTASSQAASAPAVAQRTAALGTDGGTPRPDAGFLGFNSN